MHVRFVIDQSQSAMISGHAATVLENKVLAPTKLLLEEPLIPQS
jgi:hypothetical protein